MAEYCSLLGDFEAAMWTAAKEVFGKTMDLRGCLFHWNQAVFRKIQELGLQRAFSQNQGIHKFCKAVMALPFLPQEWIKPVFGQMSQAAVTAKTKALLTYVESQWITSFTFPIPSWSVYRRPFRTNNDVEGWHHKLNMSGQLI